MANEKAKKVKALSVAAKRERFFSAGITTPFTYEARDIPLTDLTEAQIKELKEDPYLVVRETEMEVPAEASA
ncbi:MAG: hypothetical protein QE265_01245 [Rhodoferax sp.]|nr:hypothetical protein [Rhodoferax sp.]